MERVKLLSRITNSCVYWFYCLLLQDREKGKKLHQLEVPILVLDTCQSYYVNLPSKVTQRMICAGFPLEDGKDSCTVSCMLHLCFLTLKVLPDRF